MRTCEVGVDVVLHYVTATSLFSLGVECDSLNRNNSHRLLCLNVTPIVSCTIIGGEVFFWSKYIFLEELCHCESKF